MYCSYEFRKEGVEGSFHIGGRGRFRGMFRGNISGTGHRFIVCILSGGKRPRFQMKLSINGGVNGTMIQGTIGEGVHRTLARLGRRLIRSVSFVIVTHGPITRVSTTRMGGDLVRILGLSGLLGGGWAVLFLLEEDSLIGTWTVAFCARLVYYCSNSVDV